MGARLFVYILLISYRYEQKEKAGTQEARKEGRWKEHLSPQPLSGSAGLVYR